MRTPETVAEHDRANVNKATTKATAVRAGSDRCKRSAQGDKATTTRNESLEA
jgi:hypothetical protein